MAKTVSIDHRFNGPPQSGNGGYTAGLLLEAAGPSGVWTISLKAPPPLGRDLTLVQQPDRMVLADGETALAEIAEGAFEQDLPTLPAPLLFDAGKSVFADAQPFDGCFVCGPARTLPDALCIYSHPIEGSDGMVAAPWSLHPGLSDDGETVAPRYIASALDCPGYYAAAAGEPALLGRFTIEIEDDLPARGTATVIGWAIGDKSPKKRRCGTLILDNKGKRIARAEGYWILVSEALLRQIAGLPA